MPHKYTDKQYEFIKNNAKGIGNAELTEMFNNHFQLSLTVNQIKAFKKNNKINSGLDGRFSKGHIPANKGVKGMQKANITSFKKGHKPHNYVPVGSERINSDDYIDIKIEDPNKWKGKHILIWEKYNGPVPKGHAVIFADRNRRNFDINNLIMVSREQLLILNRNKLIKGDSDLTKTGVIIADLYQKINERKKSI